MELINIPRQGYWTETAAALNDNFRTVSNELENIRRDSELAKGVFTTLAELQEAYPTAPLNSWAYVGNSFPASIYIYQAGGWTDSGETGSLPDVELNDYSMSEALTDVRDILTDWGS